MGCAGGTQGKSSACKPVEVHCRSRFTRHDCLRHRQNLGSILESAFFMQIANGRKRASAKKARHPKTKPPTPRPPHGASPALLPTLGTPNPGSNPSRLARTNFNKHHPAGVHNLKSNQPIVYAPAHTQHAAWLHSCPVTQPTQPQRPSPQTAQATVTRTTTLRRGVAQSG